MPSNEGNLGPLTVTYDGPPIPAVLAIEDHLLGSAQDVAWNRIPAPIRGILYCRCRAQLPAIRTQSATVNGALRRYDFCQCSQCRRIYWRENQG